MPMTRWEFRIVPCLAGGNTSATCLKMLVMLFANVPAPLSLLRHFAAQYNSLVIINGHMCRTILEDYQIDFLQALCITILKIS